MRDGRIEKLLITHDLGAYTNKGAVIKYLQGGAGGNWGGHQIFSDR